MVPPSSSMSLGHCVAESFGAGTGKIMLTIFVEISITPVALRHLLLPLVLAVPGNPEHREFLLWSTLLGMALPPPTT